MTNTASWSDASRVILEAGPNALNLGHTLGCGQAFRWEARSDGSWVGVVQGRAIRLSRDHDRVMGDVFPPGEDANGLLSAYLRLDVDLAGLYEAFGSVDPWISSAVSQFAGLRVLLQQPQETLLSYICSTANSVPRISKAVREMSRLYGALIATLDRSDFYSFPSAETLADASPQILRDSCGLGWRGDNLKRVARDVAAMPTGWLDALRGKSYGEAKAQLMKIHGVGAKIADCVCLFALGMDEAVPVDTHIWAVAKELFGAEVPTRTLTPATYETIARMFLDRYGNFAGWAQEYLYLQRRASQGRVSL